MRIGRGQLQNLIGAAIRDIIYQIRPFLGAEDEQRGDIGFSFSLCVLDLLVETHAFIPKYQKLKENEKLISPRDSASKTTLITDFICHNSSLGWKKIHPPFLPLTQ
uniref:Uncharacterized protein n=1 Tax=Cacopsylla melanoneura TaxID=428564 RepID=A0A8D8SV88_9HEMI